MMPDRKKSHRPVTIPSLTNLRHNKSSCDRQHIVWRQGFVKCLRCCGSGVTQTSNTCSPLGYVIFACVDRRGQSAITVTRYPSFFCPESPYHAGVTGFYRVNLQCCCEDGCIAQQFAGATFVGTHAGIFESLRKREERLVVCKHIGKDAASRKVKCRFGNRSC